MRTFTVKLVTWSALVPTTFAELPISITVPAKFLPRKASTSILAESPSWMRLISFSFTSTFTSSWLRSDIVMISVPANCWVPKTRSPFSMDSLDTTPSTGEYMVVLMRLSAASFTEACDCASPKVEPTTFCLAASRAALAPK